MADIRITAVEFGQTKPAGSAFGVTVALDNKELRAGWLDDAACDHLGKPGHKALVRLIVEDAAGGTVWSESQETCVPRNRLSEMMGPNRRITFRPSIDDPGSYVVRAEVDSINAEESDASSPRSLTIQSGTQGADDPDSTSDGSGGSGGDPWNPDDYLPDDGDSLDLTPDLDTETKVALALVALLVVATVMRPYASLGATATEAVS